MSKKKRNNILSGVYRSLIERQEPPSEWDRRVALNEAKKARSQAQRAAAQARLDLLVVEDRPSRKSSKEDKTMGGTKLNESVGEIVLRMWS